MKAAPKGAAFVLAPSNVRNIYDSLRGIGRAGVQVVGFIHATRLALSLLVNSAAAP
jgi:hypothetical protein